MKKKKKKNSDNKHWLTLNKTDKDRNAFSLYMQMYQKKIVNKTKNTNR